MPDLILRFQVVLTKNGAIVRRLNTRKIRRLYPLLDKYEWDTIRLTVRYGETGFENGGEYTSAESFIAALQAFTEPENVAYAAGEVYDFRAEPGQ